MIERSFRDMKSKVDLVELVELAALQIELAGCLQCRLPIRLFALLVNVLSMFECVLFTSNENIREILTKCHHSLGKIC